MAAKLEIDYELVKQLSKEEVIENSLDFAAKHGVDHQAVVGVLGSLATKDYISRGDAPVKKKIVKLTPEGKTYLEKGTPEGKVMEVLKAGPATKDELVAKNAGDATLVTNGLKVCMKEKIISIKEGVYAPTDKAGAWTDSVGTGLKMIAEGSAPIEELVAIAAKLKSRKVCVASDVSFYKVVRGGNFPAADDIEKRSWRIKQPADFDAAKLAEMQKSNKLLDMKPVNVNAEGRKNVGGNLHPLMKLRQQYREIFLELGFQEMDTSRFVDSSFWNFDTLFVPQKHPARDSQDTFFVTHPATTKDHPEDYVQLTKKIHETGDFGSTGYRYQWSRDETERNVLRTHTTAVSSYTLYQIGQEYQKTGKLQTGAFFSIDRVFRNETMDKTHLCEFHQMEGFVIDYGLSLSNMMALLSSFFERVGVKNLKFKPAFNPYTEPSMEVHTVTESGKIIEIGNSGVFRPEMLRPMGLPEDVTVIAWGLGLERVAMRHYKLPSVHDLFGHHVSLPFIQNAAAPRH
eukprot:TRINITY_DN3318_c0_g1_i1.p1 TRINITY_DN3318_c0_g1~~TRINITY_DN3318_c0_g1_i1.p1  ORF type:complete len:514 (+),score=175.11 TRINITY_DN3318_c0_g1_i1:374-1915(+)